MCTHPYILLFFMYISLQSYPVTGGDAARAVLAQPSYGRLFFAGEAVHDRFPGTLQAAIETGVRAAQEVCDTSAKLRGHLISSAVANGGDAKHHRV